MEKRDSSLFRRTNLRGELAIEGERYVTQWKLVQMVEEDDLENRQVGKTLSFFSVEMHIELSYLPDESLSIVVNSRCNAYGKVIFEKDPVALR
jgi:hypothetical protein